MRLTIKIINSAKPKNKLWHLADGRGLRLTISPKNLKTWSIFYWKNKKKYRITLGHYPSYSLAEARSWLTDTKQILEHGIAPNELKQNKLKLDQLSPTARQLAADYQKKWFYTTIPKNKNKTELKIISLDWLNNIVPLTMKDDKETRRYVEKDIIPKLGDLPVAAITPADVLEMTDRIKARGSPSMALRAFNTLRRIFKYAITRGYISVSPAEHIDRRHIGKSGTRNRSLSADEIGLFFQQLYKSSIRRQYKLALHLLMITMLRKSELRLSKWEEVNFSDKEWLIPGERMKKANAHIVYLSDQAIKILKELKTTNDGSEYIFAAKDNSAAPIAKTTLNYIARLVNSGVDGFVLHDFRRTASTILHEHEWNTDWIEKSLVHEQRGVRGIYNKAQYADGRRKMLQWWADYVDELIGNYI